MVHAKLQELALWFATEILQLVCSAPLWELAEATGDALSRTTAARSAPPAPKRSPKRAKPTVKAKGKKRAVAKVVAVVAKVDASDTAASPARQRGVAHERDATAGAARVSFGRAGPPAVRWAARRVHAWPPR